MDLLCDTEKLFLSVCINSLSRSKPVNTCVLKPQIWVSFMYTAWCIVVRSCVQLACCCVTDKRGSEISCRVKISVSGGTRSV